MSRGLPCLLLTLTCTPALGQPILGHATSIEAHVLNADAVAVGRVVSFEDRGAEHSAGVTIETVETLRGRHRERFVVTMWHGDEQLAKWRDGRSRLLFAVRHDDSDEPPQTNFVDLAAVDLCEFDADVRPLKSPQDVLRTAKATLRERPGVTRVTTFSLTVPRDVVRETRWAGFHQTRLLVPVDPKLETRLQHSARGDDDWLRREGVEGLRHFHTPENVALARSLLDDPATGFLHHASQNRGIEVRVFTVRRTAYETLRFWGEDVEKPVLRTRTKRFDLVTLIDLSHGDVEARDVRRLRRFPNLGYLVLTHTNADDALLADVAKLPSLHSLELGATKVTDAGLESLAKLEKLRYLGLGSTKITDRGLERLATFECLKSLGLDNVETVSEAAVDRLRKARPDLEIER